MLNNTIKHAATFNSDNTLVSIEQNKNLSLFSLLFSLLFLPLFSSFEITHGLTILGFISFSVYSVIGCGLDEADRAAIETATNEILTATKREFWETGIELLETASELKASVLTLFRDRPGNVTLHGFRFTVLIDRPETAPGSGSNEVLSNQPVLSFQVCENFKNPTFSFYNATARTAAKKAVSAYKAGQTAQGGVKSSLQMETKEMKNGTTESRVEQYKREKKQRDDYLATAVETSCTSLQPGDVIAPIRTAAMSFGGGTVSKVNRKTVVVTSVYGLTGEEMQIKLTFDEMQSAYFLRGEKLFKINNRVAEQIQG